MCSEFLAARTIRMGATMAVPSSVPVADSKGGSSDTSFHIPTTTQNHLTTRQKSVENVQTHQSLPGLQEGWNSGSQR